MWFISRLKSWIIPPTGDHFINIRIILAVNQTAWNEGKFVGRDNMKTSAVFIYLKSFTLPSEKKMFMHSRFLLVYFPVAM